MELIHMVMDLVVPPILIMALVISIPPYFVYSLVSFIYRSFSVEDMAGKVVLITGASSGIGENIAYAYAKRGARLTLVARREELLQQVAKKAVGLGSPDVLVCCGDVSKVEDCKNFIQETINRFGQLDHLVNNAGITSVYTFEEVTDITVPRKLMEVNFWGSVYPTHFAIPHLRKSKGRIVVVSSLAGWLYSPHLILYGATKAALMNFFDTLRVELGSDIKITMVSPGFIESEMTQGKQISKDGSVEINPEKADALLSMLPARGAGECANTIVRGACRGDRDITDPYWFSVSFIWKVFVPRISGWFMNFMFVSKPGITANSAALSN